MTDMAKAPKLREGKVISMSNALIRAGHGLTLAEKRLIALAAERVDSRKPFPANCSTRITATDYAETFDVDLNTAYTALKGAAKNLYNRSINFCEEYQIGKRLALKTTVMRWVGRATYIDQEGAIDLVWFHELAPHLFNLKKEFTTFKLKQASSLRSAYSWRLLELLMRFENTGVAEYTVDDFATAMDVTAKQRANFNNIRRRIIEPAIKELTDKDGWLIEWQPIKAGRKVKRLRFTFQHNPQGSLPFDRQSEPCGVATKKITAMISEVAKARRVAS
jgi:plasmid replication initiation protein